MKLAPLILVSYIFSAPELNQDILSQLGFILNYHDLTNNIALMPQADLVALPIKEVERESSSDITFLLIKPDQLRCVTCTFDEKPGISVGTFADIEQLYCGTVKSINMTDASCECLDLLHRREYITQEFLQRLFDGENMQRSCAAGKITR